MRSGGGCRMDMSSANQHRCSLGSRPFNQPRRARRHTKGEFCFALRELRVLRGDLWTYWVHSSKAAGSPRKYARTSPAKWSEPVIKIGFGLACAISRASTTDGVVEIVGQPLWLPAGEAPALQTAAMLSKIFAKSSGRAARS